MNSERRDAIEASVIDYLLVPGHLLLRDLADKHPPAKEPVDLGRGLSLERLDYSVADDLMDQCTPGNLKAKRQYGQVYSFVRRDSPQPEGPSFAWDTDLTLQTAVALSRFVVPNAYSTEYAVSSYDFGGESEIKYVPVSSVSGFASYRVKPDETRDWLESPEALELRKLLDRYWAQSETLPPRVRRAMWFAEFSTRYYAIDFAWPQVVTGLEALFNTDKSKSTAQFKIRVAAVATELGIEDADETFTDNAYDTRSRLVHGSQLGSEDDDQLLSDFELLQRILRMAVRRAIEDESFGNLFRDDQLIRDRWPIA